MKTKSKKQIIKDFQERQKKLLKVRDQTDGMKYLDSLPRDPYCMGYEMPKEKYPEYHKWKDDYAALQKEYSDAITPLAKYAKGDIVIVGCEDSIEFGTVNNDHFFITTGDDILYQVYFTKAIDAWKYGSSGGGFGGVGGACNLAFREIDILMKVCHIEMDQIQNTPIDELKHMYPELFPLRKYDEKLDGIRNLVVGFVEKINLT
jgi:hypothetical protein